MSKITLLLKQMTEEADLFRKKKSLFLHDITVQILCIGTDTSQ